MLLPRLPMSDEPTESAEAAEPKPAEPTEPDKPAEEEQAPTTPRDSPSAKKAAEKAAEKAKEKEEAWQPRPILSPRAAWALAAVSAILCPVGFVGIGIWPVAFIAWVPLMLALRGQPPKRALALGWFAGFCMTMIGFNWLIGMLEV